MSAEKRKLVGDGWTWFTDYAYFTASWTLHVEFGREVELGVGISFRGKPRGGVRRISGHHSFTTFGVGAIQVRAVDGNGSCLVGLSIGDVEPIQLYQEPSMTDQVKRQLGG